MTCLCTNLWVITSTKGFRIDFLQRLIRCQGCGGCQCRRARVEQRKPARPVTLHRLTIAISKFLGRTAVPPPKVKPYLELRRWTAAEERIVRKLPPRNAARKLGRTLAAVMYRRNKLGLGRSWRHWTAAEDRIVSKLTPVAAAKRLPRRTLHAIRTRRFLFLTGRLATPKKRKRTYRRLSSQLERLIIRRVESERVVDVARDLGISRQTIWVIRRRLALAAL
jgi:hypothetical protein